MTRQQQKKVLLVCADNDGPATGFAVRVKLIAQSLAENRTDVIILRLPNLLKPNSSWAGTTPKQVELIELPMLPGLRIGALIAMSQFIRSIAIHAIAIWKKVSIIQAENTLSGEACTLVRWSNTPIIVDLHGAVIEEAIFNRGEDFKKTTTFRWLQAAEACSIRKADQIFVVADPMVSYLKEKYPALDIAKVHIVPVAADSIFFSVTPEIELKRKLGFATEDIIFVYSGGAQRYQCITETISIFSKIHQQKKNTKLLILSIDKEQIRSTIAQFPETAQNIVIESLEKADVAKYLSIADLGFLLRQEDILNRVSCPTKFAEYAACGVSVITTKAAGHAPHFVEQFGNGIVIELHDEDRAVQQILSFFPKLGHAQRQLCKNMAATHLHWDQAVEKIEYVQTLLVNG